MLELNGVKHVYGRQTAVKIDAWRADDGEQWLLHGPSGCGKTTLCTSWPGC
jgi:ABC-type sugar transport system ATPase subunit